MTIDEALKLTTDTYVSHRTQVEGWVKDTPQPRPLKIKEVWVNEKKTIVRITVQQLTRNTWYDATDFDLLPDSLVPRPARPRRAKPKDH